LQRTTAMDAARPRLAAVESTSVTACPIVSIRRAH
jgi:hypothetical protein